MQTHHESITVTEREFRVKFITFPIKCMENCSSVFTQKKVKQRILCRERGRFRRTSRRSGAPGTTSRLSSSRRTGSFIQTLSETEYHTRFLFEEERNQILSGAKFELLQQETRAEHAVNSIQNLNRQLRSQNGEMCRTGQEYEVA